MRPIWNEGIDWNEQLWRYFRPDRYAQTLQTGKLYFAASTQFTDRFEGATSVLPPDFPVDPRFEDPDFWERARIYFRRLFKINCWHRADYESNAMWHLYAESGKGVAIISSPERMRNAIQPFRLQLNYGTEDVWAGAVRYHDLMTVRLRFHDQQLYCCKHQAFSWEREFRLIISLMQADEFDAGVPDDGVGVDVNLDTPD